MQPVCSGSPRQRKNIKLTFAQLLGTFLFPQGLEVSEKEIANTIDLWNDDHNEVCEACGRGGSVILCEACNLAYHPKCLKIKEVGDEGWLCPECSEELYRKVEKNVRRDEKMKLKAELDALEEEDVEAEEEEEEEEEYRDEKEEEGSKTETEADHAKRKLRKRAKKEAKRLRKLDRQEKREKRKRLSRK